MGGDADSVRKSGDRDAGNRIAQQALKIDPISGGRHPFFFPWWQPADWLGERAARRARLDLHDSHSPFVREV